MSAALDQPIQFLPGGGPAIASRLEKLELRTLRDLLYHFPRRYLDRSQIRPLRELGIGDEATVEGWVVGASARRTRARRENLHMTFRDATGHVDVVFFNQGYLAKRFPPGTRLLLWGRLETYDGKRQLRSPEFEILTDEDQEHLHTGRIVPIYPATAGVTQKRLRLLVRTALDRCQVAGIPDALPEALRSRRRLLAVAPALEALHFPVSEADRDMARRRFVFEELFSLQLLLGVSRRRREAIPGIAFDAPGRLLGKAVSELPFALTPAQTKALEGIRKDLALPRVMHRLLEGDVGSGKTVVAFLAALVPIEAGYQAAFLAPTEILAEQHFRTISAFAKPLGVRTALLTGSLKAEESRKIRMAVARGAIQILVGTHAILEEGVRFPNLGFAVVDEQHRFGVAQRAALTGKGANPDVLVMSATPIPRSLAMTLYGDLDLSVLDALPAGRKPVVTRVTEEAKRGAVLDFAAERIREGRQVYVVLPLIEASADSDLLAAREMAESLRGMPRFAGISIGLLHGRMRPKEKERTMREFTEGRISLLVATTVVEVGVDVPNASVMILEHPERYGLSQLHQLRGRVGRGAHKSYCVLVAGSHLPAKTRERLEVLETTHDGFAIAEADLRFRGPGEILGVRQHGLPDLRVADLVLDQHVLREAEEDVTELLAADPGLDAPRNAALRARVESALTRSLSLLSSG